MTWKPGTHRNCRTAAELHRFRTAFKQSEKEKATGEAKIAKVEVAENTCQTQRSTEDICKIIELEQIFKDKRMRRAPQSAVGSAKGGPAL